MTASHGLAKPVGSLLLALAFALALLAVAMSRADSRDGLPAWVALDVVVGMVVAGGLFLLKLHWRSKLFRAGLSIAGAVVVAASLLWWHEAVASIPAKTAALKQVTMVRGALDRFKEDCGRFPSQEESLTALVENPRIQGWHGPYAKSRDLIDPWGRSLLFQPSQYQYQGNDTVDVWSVGPDGQNGTDDDIHVRYFHACYWGRE